MSFVGHQSGSRVWHYEVGSVASGGCSGWAKIQTWTDVDEAIDIAIHHRDFCLLAPAFQSLPAKVCYHQLCCVSLYSFDFIDADS